MARATPPTRRQALCVLGATALTWPCLGWGSSGWPPSMALTYDIEGQSGAVPYRATGSLHWQHGGGRYVASLRVKVLWLSREQTSQGTLGASMLEPRQFTDSKGQGSEARFDAAAARVVYSHGGQAPLHPGMQDEISLYFAMARALEQQPGAPWQVYVSNATGQSLWTFEALAPSTQETPSGAWPTQPMRRRLRREGDTQATLWLAPGLHGLPVRVLLQHGANERVDQRLTGYTPLPALGA
ncbi:MAG: DUF3108 domain-containing protein [Burkholderiaceae bacterium]